MSHSLALTYGVINWVTKAIFLGSRKIYLSPQTDDFFLPNHLFVRGNPACMPGGFQTNPTSNLADLCPAGGLMTARILVLLAIVSSSVTAGEPPAARMHLDEVMRAAVATAKAGEARMDLAESSLRYLETLNRTRIELRPSLGLFAFSSPALLAANIGTGLLFNRRTAPAPGMLDNARFDALAAEVNAENLKVRTQLEAARGYFDLLGKQQVVQLAAETLALRRGRGAEMERFLEASRITAAEELAWQQELLDVETAWVNAEAERKASAVRLAALIGKPEAGNALAVADVDLAVLASGKGVPGVDRLMTLALEYRGEARLLREKLQALGGSPARRRKVALETINAGYSYVGNRTGVSDAFKDNVLGGNTGRGELTLNVPLRNTGERAAHDAVAAARVRLLELELRSMEDALRLELTGLEDAARSSLERLRLATRKLELARRTAEVVRTRAESGLAPLTATWAADQGVLGAESAYLQADYERKSTLYALLVVCGVEQQPVAFETGPPAR
jgi:outer membrane protein TolC